MFRFLEKLTGKQATEDEQFAAEIWAGGRRIEDTVPSSRIPADSHPWNADGKLIHSLEKCAEEYETVAIEAFDDKLNITPDALHDALNWPELQRMLSPKPSLLEKINAGLTIALFAILCLFTFLIFSSLVSGEAGAAI